MDYSFDVRSADIQRRVCNEARQQRCGTTCAIRCHVSLCIINEFNKEKNFKKEIVIALQPRPFVEILRVLVPTPYRLSLFPIIYSFNFYFYLLFH